MNVRAYQKIKTEFKNISFYFKCGTDIRVPIILPTESNENFVTTKTIKFC